MRTIELKDDDDLFLHGKATDHIWLMEDVPGFIGVRMDCGDSGAVYLTQAQAADLHEQLSNFVPKIKEPAVELLDALEALGVLCPRCGASFLSDTSNARQRP